MKVTVVFLQEFIREAGTHRMVVELEEGARVRDLLERLPRSIRERVVDEEGRVRWPAEIAVNGRRIEFLDGLDTVLRDGDTVIVSPRALFVL